MTDRMNDDRLDDRDLSTADIANASTERLRPGSDALDREVSLSRGRSRADEGDADFHLLPDDVVSDLRPRWSEIQGSFVDAPRQAVQEADQLVAEAMRRLAEAFSSTRADLERDWDRGEDVSTEDLRLALRRYRAFFDRLLNA